MFRTVSIMLATLALAACGGSDNHAFEPPASGGSSSASVASVTVVSTASSIPADGSSTATITALVKDANNNAITGATVGFSADKGSLVVASTTTDSSGTTTATLSGTGATAGSSIKVTATSGTVSGNTSVSVVNTQQTISISTSSPQIASDGSTSATITATVQNSGNQVISGVPVNITSTSGVLVVTRGTTDATGTATATLTSANDPTNRRITVTAAAGAASASVPVDVIGTKLVYTGLGNLVQGSQSTYTATLTDSGGVAIPGKTVTFASSNGNTLSAASGTTNSLGQVSVQLIAVNGGTDNLTASTLGLTATQPVSISNQNFSFTAPAANTNVGLGANQTITVNWKSSGVPQAGKTITFSATRGQFAAPSPNLWAVTPNPQNMTPPNLSSATAVTDANGNATLVISSAASGPSVIAASSTGVSAQMTIDFIATTPASVLVQASPATIPTQGQSTISAVVRDANNNLVEGQTVDFVASDVTSGQLTVASAVTDAQGRAQTVFIANSTPSSSSGVTITANVQNSSVTGATTLTVGGQALRITLGTGIHVVENDDKTRFLLPYSVTVVDSAGNPVNNRSVTLTIHSVSYGKGAWAKPGSTWVTIGDPALVTTSPLFYPPVTVCPNEDANLNGILERNLGEDVAGQGNNNGFLEPGDVATVDASTVWTNSSGVADFNVVYPEDRAMWVTVNLTATSTVAGSESSTSAIFLLPTLVDYLTAATPPPGQPSPYGVKSTCTDPN